MGVAWGSLMSWVLAGFIHWMTFNDFIAKYCMLVPDYIPRPNIHPAELLEGMLVALGRVVEEVELGQEHYAIGNTKIFIKYITHTVGV